MVADLVAAADWDVPRPVATCRHLLEAARAHGVAADDCLAGTDLSPIDIADNATEVQAGQELAIARNILARVEDPHALVRDVGVRYNFANTGVLGYALLASPTLGDIAPLLIGQLESTIALKVELPGVVFPVERLEFPGLTVEFDFAATRVAPARLCGDRRRLRLQPVDRHPAEQVSPGQNLTGVRIHQIAVRFAHSAHRPRRSE